MSDTNLWGCYQMINNCSKKIIGNNTHIACWGYYGERNIGDDLILQNLLKFLQQRIPDANVRVHSNSDDVKRLSPNGLHITVVNRSILESVVSCITADLIICGPGGLFPHHNTKKLIFWNILLLLTKLFGKRMAFIGIGIGLGNFNSTFDRFLLRNLVIHSDRFVTRQKGIPEYIHLRDKDLHRCVEASDVLFSVYQIKKFKQSQARDKKIVLSLADVFSDKREDKHIFLAGISQSLNKLIELGYTLTLLTFTDEKDAILNQELIKYIDASEKVCVFPFPENPQDILTEFAGAEICISMRFHALVIASCLNIPCCVIAYSEKLDDVANRLNLSKFLVRICSDKKTYYHKRIPFDAKYFERILFELLSKRTDIQNSMSEDLDIIIRESEINWYLLDRLLSQMKGYIAP